MSSAISSRFSGGTLTGSLNLGANPIILGSAPTEQIITDGAGGFLLRAYTAEPTVAPTVALAGGGVGNCTNGTHVVAYSFITAGGATMVGPASVAVTVTDNSTNGKIAASVIAVGNQFVTGRDVWMSKANTTTPLYRVAASPVMPATGTTLTIDVADANLTVAAPTTNTALDTRATIANNGTITGGPLASATKTMVGTGTATANIGGTYAKFVSAAGVGNGADTSHDALWTPTAIPANTLTANGDALHLCLSFKTAANGNNKQIGITVKTTNYPSNTIATNAGYGVITMTITRVDSTHVNVLFSGVLGGNVVFGGALNAAIDELTTNTLTIIVTGASTTSSGAGDILLTAGTMDAKK